MINVRRRGRCIGNGSDRPTPHPPLSLLFVMQTLLWTYIRLERMMIMMMMLMMKHDVVVGSVKYACCSFRVVCVFVCVCVQWTLSTTVLISYPWSLGSFETHVCDTPIVLILWFVIERTENNFMKFMCVNSLHVPT